MNQLLTPQALTLCETMVNAREDFIKAHGDYLDATAIAMDTGANADQLVALRREGRACAAALTRYTESTMAWLVFVETCLSSRQKSSTG